jgi:hypothetical protein
MVLLAREQAKAIIYVERGLILPWFNLVLCVDSSEPRALASGW